jgi:phthiocerol/phenolphthiocerol synthesis type-I polyketide synthase E
MEIPTLSGESKEAAQRSESDIAIIGMSGRFPGANNIEALWRSVRQGVESISQFTDEQLLAAGTSPELLSNPDFVGAGGVLEGADLFDAAFFGFSPREAQILDPQQRIFLECAWETMESAGYDCERYTGRVGVFAGASMNTYLLTLYSVRELVDSVSPYQILIANDKDFLTSRVSYKLNLRGPSVTVQTACSTSLVAVHLACQSLLNGESDMVLAGGVSIRFPQAGGYLYREGSFLSPDGHCRAFDAHARGTVTGNGVGVVLLKRLEDALDNRDCIHAIIKGTAVNNDGSLKAGFTAPSVSPQASVIAEAQAMARVDPETISYVEAHGTGTALGDPIEVAALTEAFRVGTARKRFCALGSVKTNIGHLDAAAGVVGLIKTVKALKGKQLPPSLHFEEPNPKIDFENSPFYVNTVLKDWETGGEPRRAGVSSFGIGGTNAHVVLEEARPVHSGAESRSNQLLILSARTELALDHLTRNLLSYLRQSDSAPLADVAYTLQVGRKVFDHRRTLACRDRQDAIRCLESLDPHRVFTLNSESEDRPVVFLFPGQGVQHIDMARELYNQEPTFRHHIDTCSALLESHIGADIRSVIYPSSEDSERASGLLHQTFITQPALFVTEYALARLWMDWGVRPAAMIGHSIGEYVAACIAEVLTLEDALQLVAARGRLMQELPDGLMLSVPLPASQVVSMLDSRLSLAAVNSPSMCVVSGELEAVAELESSLGATGVKSKRLRTGSAFHSHLCDAIAERFKTEVSKIPLSDPVLPYISNVTGTWITREQAKDPAYWTSHLRQTVLFSEGIRELLKGFEGVLLEVGPGDVLSNLARQHERARTACSVVPSLARRELNRDQGDTVLVALGHLWMAGVNIGWSGFHAGESRVRTPLPTYPFQRQRYWIDEYYNENAAGITKESMTTGGLHPRPKLPNRYEPPQNELQQGLAEIWQRLLGIADIGIHDDFFSLGGHSLLATQMISIVKENFEIEASLQTLFQSPTIAELAEQVEELLVNRLEELTDDEVQRLLKT